MRDGRLGLEEKRKAAKNLRLVLLVVGLARGLLEIAMATFQLSYFIENMTSRIGC